MKPKQIELKDFIKENRRKVKLKNLNAKQGFTFEDDKLLAIRRKIEAAGVPLGEIEGVEILKGIETGCNKAFFVDKEFRDKISLEEPQSLRFLNKRIDKNIVDRYKIEWKGEYVISVPKGWTNSNKTCKDAESWFKRNHPLIYNHIKNIADGIESGIIHAKGGVYSRSCKGDYWWESGNININKLPKEYSVYIEIAATPKFSYGNEPAYIIAALYFISGELAKGLTSFMNTKIASTIFGKFYSTEFSGAFRYKTPYLINMVVPIGVIENISVFEEFTDQIQALKKEGKPTDHLEAEVEKIVQELYGLTDEEVEYLCK